MNTGFKLSVLNAELYFINRYFNTELVLFQPARNLIKTILKNKLYSIIFNVVFSTSGLAVKRGAETFILIVLIRSGLELFGF